MCDKCKDTGLVYITVEGYDNPLWSDKYMRVSIPHNDKIINHHIVHDLVLDCECHHAAPLSVDDMVCAVMDYLGE